MCEDFYDIYVNLIEFFVVDVKFLGNYKDQHWYFEAVFFLRRFMLSTFVALPFNTTNEKIYSMVFVISVFLLIVMFTRPFYNSYNNYAEMTFQSALILVAIGFIVNKSDSVGVVTDILILLPIIICCIFVYANHEST